MDLRIFPPEELLDATVALPLSKSVSNRVAAIAALTPGMSLPALAECDDTRAMLEAIDSRSDTVNIGAAGTAMRFLTAVFAATPGREVVLDGSARMRKRPIGPLVDALRTLGAQIEYAGEEGFPPLRISGRRLAGGAVSVDAGVSSQFISALLLAAPAMEAGLELTLTGEAVSQPYVAMTLGVMRRFGAECEREGNVITVAPGTYRPAPGFEVEADWSAASYWYEIQALTCGWTKLLGLTADSLQGDSAVARLFGDLGVESGFETDPVCADLEASPDLAPRFVADLADTPDIAQTIAVTCALLGVPFRLTGLGSLRIKETDRIAALRTELGKLGITLEPDLPDTLEWLGGRLPIAGPPEFDTYDDHRMAMAFAPVAVFLPGIVIRNAEVVSKSYPQFWEHLAAAGFTVRDAAVTTADADEPEA